MINRQLGNGINKSQTTEDGSMKRGQIKLKLGSRQMRETQSTYGAQEQSRSRLKVPTRNHCLLYIMKDGTTTTMRCSHSRQAEQLHQVCTHQGRTSRSINSKVKTRCKGKLSTESNLTQDSSVNLKIMYLSIVMNSKSSKKSLINRHRKLKEIRMQHWETVLMTRQMSFLDIVMRTTQRHQVAKCQRLCI